MSNAALLMRERTRNERLTLGDKLLLVTLGGLAFLATSPTLKEMHSKRVANERDRLPITAPNPQSAHQQYMVLRYSDGRVEVYERMKDGGLALVQNPSADLLKVTDGIIVGNETYR